MQTNSSNSYFKLLKPKQVSELIGVSEGTLAVWRSSQRYSLSYCKIGYRVMYRESDVLDFVGARQVGGVLS